MLIEYARALFEDPSNDGVNLPMCSDAGLQGLQEGLAEAVEGSFHSTLWKMIWHFVT
jgi:hypothetical protein